MTRHSAPTSGFQGFMQDLRRQVDWANERNIATGEFMQRIAERYAYIRLADLRRPLQFLRQISSRPPTCFGPKGFRHTLVDDQEPARHYMAFVFVGYWLPTVLATLLLWAWEVLGFVRYGGHWSQPDIRCGTIGIRHGRAVRKNGPTILPMLVQRELGEAVGE